MAVVHAFPRILSQPRDVDLGSAIFWFDIPRTVECFKLSPAMKFSRALLRCFLFFQLGVFRRLLPPFSKEEPLTVETWRNLFPALLRYRSLSPLLSIVIIFIMDVNTGLSCP
jgi:hypothetical protein